MVALIVLFIVSASSSAQFPLTLRTSISPSWIFPVPIFLNPALASSAQFGQYPVTVCFHPVSGALHPLHPFLLFHDIIFPRRCIVFLFFSIFLS